MIEIKADQESFQKVYDLMDKWEEKARKALAEAHKEGALHLQSSIQDAWPVDTGQSKRAWLVKQTLAEDSITSTVYNETPYAQFLDNPDPSVEFTRAPGSAPPPVSSLEGWARRRNIPRSKLVAIARAIGKRGFKNRLILVKVIQREGPAAISIVKTRFKQKMSSQ